jgi:hypothetical protein
VLLVFRAQTAIERAAEPSVGLNFRDCPRFGVLHPSEEIISIMFHDFALLAMLRAELQQVDPLTLPDDLRIHPLKTGWAKTGCMLDELVWFLIGGLHV